MSDRENEELNEVQKNRIKLEKQVRIQKHQGQQRIYAKRLPR
jgi:hypothetical protein